MNKTSVTFLALLALCLPALAQDFSFGPKIFSLRDARLSLGIGYEAAIAFENDMKQKTVIYHHYSGPGKIRADFTGKAPYRGYTLAIDLFAPTSLLGLFAEVCYFESGFQFKDGPTETGDTYNLTLLEFPVFLKIRPGKIDSQKRFFLMLGGSYSMPLTAEYTANGVSGKDKGIFQNFIGLGGMLGYELLGSDEDTASTGKIRGFRSILFTRANYRFQSPFNSDFPAPITSFATNSNLNFHDLFVTFGIQFYYRFNTKR